MTATHPVILVHGYLATGFLMMPLRIRLEGAGLSTYTLRLPFLNLPDISLCTAALKTNLEQLLASLAQEKCDLIGVSLGGFMGMEYIKKMGGAKRVRKMIAVGTPFKGTKAAVPAVHLLGWISKAAGQCLPGSEYLKDLESGPLPGGVEYHSIAAHHDPVAPPESCGFPGVDSIVIDAFPPPLTHQSLIFVQPVFSAIMDILKS